MHPYWSLFGRSFPVYGLMIALGGMIALGWALVRVHRAGLDGAVLIVWVTYACVTALIGAKVMYILVTYPMAVWPALFAPERLRTTLTSGFVIYGGLIGGALGALLAQKVHHLPVVRQLNAVAPVIPLAQAFGRVGCLLAGCCYGFAYDGPFCMVFSHPYDAMTPVGVPLFPTQALACAGDLLLCVALLIYTRKPRPRGRAMMWYYALYAAGRFGLEFLRGDAERGMWGGLSTAQWTSIAVLAVTVWLLVRTRRGKRTKIAAN